MEKGVKITATYLEALLELQGAAIKIFLWAVMNCNENTIILAKPQKEKLMIACGFKSFQSVANGITALVNQGILIREGSCTYLIHPSISWKGSHKKRMELSKALRNVELKVNYEIGTGEK